jgi:D-alanyl-D-alanine carboxypeptidase
MNNNLKDIFSIENRTKYFIHFIIFLFLAAVMIFVLLISNNKDIGNKENTISQKTNPFNNIELEAKSAIVWDVVNQKEIFVKNPDVPLPLASLTKVMTAVTADSNLPDGLDIKITQDYLEPEGDSQLVVGDTWQASDLRDFTLLTSSNDGAFALAAVAEAQVNREGKDPRIEFIKAMNDKASEIGLSNSHFFNEHGLDRTLDKGGAYGTSRDMALLFEYTLQNHPKILEATRYKNLHFASNEKVYSAQNTNTFADQIPNLIASKTGYTDLAGGNLVIAFDPGLNRPIIISILGSSEEGRFRDTLKLVVASMQYLEENN